MCDVIFGWSLQSSIIKNIFYLFSLLIFYFLFIQTSRFSQKKFSISFLSRANLLHFFNPKRGFKLSAFFSQFPKLNKSVNLPRFSLPFSLYSSRFYLQKWFYIVSHLLWSLRDQAFWSHFCVEILSKWDLWNSITISDW